MTIVLGGHEFSESEVLAAIAASDNAGNVTVSAYSSVDEVSGVLQAVLHRVAALEDRLPVTHNGFGVTTTTVDNVTTYRVQAIDQRGNSVIFQFEYPPPSTTP